MAKITMIKPLKFQKYSPKQNPIGYKLNVLKLGIENQ